MKRHIHMSRDNSRRGGAVIIVVISLLTTLVFLGLFFFNWTSQEIANAELFADPDESGMPAIDPNPIFDRAAEQLIVGTREGDSASALWGGVHSLLAHQIGRIDGNLKPTDSNVGTGRGIVMETEDVDDDGVIDPLDHEIRFRYVDATDPANDFVRDLNDIVLNFSPIAGSNVTPNFRPNVDYTYPDINNMFLAHEEEYGDGKILIPSFFRPQLFPEYRSSDSSKSFENLYSDSAHMAKVFRPHRGNLYSTGEPRYLQGSITANSGDTSRTLKPFPFPANADEAKMGIFNNPTSGANYTLLDTDVDGDGVNDSIWIDLDLAMIHFADGKQYVPLASFKVIDADGLINLNAHGNIQAALKLSRPRHGDGEPLSVSNLGMSRSEVNPLWALSRDVNALTDKTKSGEVLRNVADRFGFDPSQGTPSPLELANLEWLMLLQGWNPQQVAGQPVLGRYGDRQQLILNNDSPSAGGHDIDIDRDNGRYGRNFNDPDLLGLGVPAFVHPLSPIGLGLGTFGTPANQYLSASGVRVLGHLGTATNPMRWPQYQNFRISNYPNNLNPNPPESQLVNEDDEAILEPGHYDYGVHDSPFPPSENMALHVGKEDLEQMPFASRISSLARANLGSPDTADNIRRRFTTDSWDRLEFNYAELPNRDWEREPSGVFPRTFFRQEIQDLFRTDVDYRSHFGALRPSPRHRLNLNGILSNDSNYGGAPAFVDSSPRYRELVPHPVKNGPDPAFPATDTDGHLTHAMYHGGGVPPVPFSAIESNRYAQEWWARYDRQRLARDIYSLLWVLGRNESAAPDENQAREMAQFAVNVVDSLDRDNVITRFEYNWDLDNGWNPTSSTTGRVVYGIEEQQLVFSEWLLIETAAEDEDSDFTYHKEDVVADKGHRFLYLELRNTSPYPISLADETWRIARYNNEAATGVPDKSVKFTASGLDSIPAGGTFTIACHDSRVVNKHGSPIGSAIYIDVDGALKPVVPRVEVPDDHVVTQDSSQPVPAPLFDLDLSHPDHRDHHNLAANESIVEQIDKNMPGAEFTLSLQRRRNLDADGRGEGDEWIEVDRVRVKPTEFGSPGPVDLVAMATADQVRSEFRKWRSFERRHPFTSERSLSPWGETDPSAPLVKHSMRDREHPEKDVPNDFYRGVPTPTNTAPFSHWQPHFDRDFSSVMELLSIPLYGNRGPGSPAYSDTAVLDHGVVGNLVDDNDRLSGHRTAQVRFLNPSANYDDYPTSHPWREDPVKVPHYQNRWYRLLEFVDVKSQDQLRIDPETAVVRRTPGKINLNTIRHEAVLAGLIDDPYHIDPRNPATMTADKLESGRHWYLEHRLARDGRDSFMVDAGLDNVLIPGGFSARPFRSLSYLDATKLDSSGNVLTSSADDSIQQTILRKRDTVKWFDDEDERWHGLYDARSSADVTASTVDYHTKNRILSKIANNSTTRSHVFFVWVGLDFFEAHRNSNGNVQIGAKAEDVPGYRMFCVVDMSRLEEAYNPVTGTFDFRKFIIHRQLLP